MTSPGPDKNHGIYTTIAPELEQKTGRAGGRKDKRRAGRPCGADFSREKANFPLTVRPRLI